MKEMYNKVCSLMQEEQERASKLFGVINNSDHESYSVILEEIQETEQELFTVMEKVNHFWEWVKKNGSDKTKMQNLQSAKTAALLCACEAIQVATMCDKAINTIKDRKKESTDNG